MISIIIPVYNEAARIENTISNIIAACGGYEIEIIVSDGGSTDDTLVKAKNSGAIILTGERKGRAAQMNKGASVAKGEIFYFLHADCKPPRRFTDYILEAIDKGASSGCFRLAFDFKHWFLKANCWFTRFDVNAVRFGDQSLFVTKNVFQKSGGFKEELLMMEDQEIIHRLKAQGKFYVMKPEIITSARKYTDNGIYRMQAIFFSIWLMYYLGCSPSCLLKWHRRLIRNHKL